MLIGRCQLACCQQSFYSASCLLTSAWTLATWKDGTHSDMCRSSRAMDTGAGEATMQGSRSRRLCQQAEVEDNRAGGQSFDKRRELCGHLIMPIPDQGRHFTWGTSTAAAQSYKMCTASTLIKTAHKCSSIVDWVVCLLAIIMQHSMP